MCVVIRLRYCPEDSSHSRTAGPVYALDWCKRPTVGPNGRPGVRIAAGSLTDDFRNQIAILGLRDERVLVEDDADAHSELVSLVEATHGYPATCVQWQPASSNDGGWTNKQMQTGADLLASTGDLLRVWSFGPDPASATSSYVGRQALAQYSLTVRHQLQGVSTININTLLLYHSTPLQ
jgi:WD repeat-containing protein 68